MEERIISLIGKENLDKLKNLKILIVGIGGVGSYVLEGLIRSCIINITIIDYDKIDISNLNRQIYTNISNINKNKVEEAKKRALLINEKANIIAVDKYLNEENINILDNYEFDYIIDACDSINTKISLIKYAKNKNVKIITCLGTGNKLNPEKLHITKLNKTYNDPLAKKLRYELKKENINLNIDVLWSEELPIIKTNTISSMIFVPASAGLLISSYIVRSEIERN